MVLSCLLPAPATAAPRTPPMAEPVPAGLGRGGSWPTLLGVGGASWLLLAALSALAAPDTALTGLSWARGAQALWVFVAATAGYRMTLTLGWPPGGRARARVVVLALLIAAAVTLLVPQLADALLTAVRDRPGSMPHPGAARVAVLAQRFLPSYLLGLSATLLALTAAAAARARHEAAALAGECAGARMQMLSAQLQPHFLFNALHAISVLVDDSPRRASAMIARLGDFLRHALESGRWPWTDLASELAGVEAYLAVQQMRFGDTLRVSVEAGVEARTASVPALLLQPLIENAIEHGRSAEGAELTVHIAASVVGARLCIVVGNSHSRLSRELTPADFGHGLGNVEQRLRAAYGEGASLTIGPDRHGGTAAFLNLPRRTFSPARAARERP
jgi:two-component system, LytTR family, sensor kinase